MSKQKEALLNKSIRELDLPFRTMVWLEKEGINTIGELASKKETDLLSLKYCGNKKIKQIKNSLKELDLIFGEGDVNQQIEDGVNIYSFPFFNRKKAKQDLANLSLKILDIPLNALGIEFSVRAKHALENLKLKTLKDILVISPDTLLGARHVGKKTFDEIAREVRIYINNNRDVLIACESKHIKNEKLAKTFPIFEGTSFDIDIEKISEGKMSQICISFLNFSEKLIRKLRKMRIFTLKDLLYTEMTAVIEKCTPKEAIEAREKTYDTIRQILQEKGECCENIMDCIRYLENEYTARNMPFSKFKPREIKILKLRCGLEGESKTLRDVAEGMKITRERVRQIEKNTLETLYASLKISCRLVMSNLVNECYKNGGMILCKGLKNDRNGIGLKLFNELVKTLDKQIQYISGINIWKVKDDRKDEQIRVFLSNKLKAGECFDEKEFIGLVEQCGQAFGIGKISIEPLKKYLTVNWFKYSNNRYFFKRIRAVVLIEETFKKYFTNGVAIFKEYDKIIAAFKKEGHEELQGVSKSYLQNTIIGIDAIFLWDWGVYIHKDCIKIKDEILDKVCEWLQDKFANKKLTKVSLWGAFKQFKRECCDSGIPNEHALYSCMKMKFSNKYSFLEDPYVYPLGTKGTVEGKEFIEQYFFNAKKAVSTKEMGDVLGIKDFQIAGLLNNSEKIKAWGVQSYIHIDNININKEGLNELADYIKQNLNKYTHMSVHQIFQDKIVTCKKIGFDSAKILYSMLEHYHGAHFFFPRYPYIMLKDHGIEDDGDLSLNDLVGHYFHENIRIISQSELCEYFVKERGYKKSRIENIRYLCNDIVRYSQGTFVSLDTINWDSEKEKQLERIAIDSFDRNCVLGLPFSTIDDLLECELPTINENIEIHWQRLLLRELLERIESISILGSIRGIYVVTPNKFNIDNTEDLICYILKKEFNGATSKDVFTGRLKELRITGTLSGKNTDESKCKFIVDREEVYLSEMRTQ